MFKKCIFLNVRDNVFSVRGTLDRCRRDYQGSEGPIFIDVSPLTSLNYLQRT